MKTAKTLHVLGQSLSCVKQGGEIERKESQSPALKEYIVDKHSDLKMGARPLKRAIQTMVEDALAEEILSGRVKTGDHVSVGYREKKVIFTVKN